MSKSKYTITINKTFFQTDLTDILCSCFEGGCNWWCQIQNGGMISSEYIVDYSGEDRIFNMEADWDEAEAKFKRIKDSTFEDEMYYLLSNNTPVILKDIESGKYHILTMLKLLNGIKLAIQDGKWDGQDTGNVDGYVGDCIIQYALFGEIIYG